MNEFSELAGCKITMQKPITLLNTNGEQIIMKLREQFHL